MPAPSAEPGPAPRPLGAVRRIAVLRALVLGDMLCAVPALQALRQRFPDAHIALVGLPWAGEWVRRVACVDEFIAFPGHPGLPERTPDEAAWPGFVAAMRARQFDLVVQLHGSGRLTNGIVAEWGARHVAAFHEPGRAAPDPALSLPWPQTGNEAQRLLSLMAVLGAPAAGGGRLSPADAFPVREADREAAQGLLLAHGAPPGRPWVCLHAGAQWPSRRWPPARFAQVGRALATAHDLTLVLTGVASESPVVAALEAALQGLAPGRCLNLVGLTPLWTVGALIEGARLLVSNDTGVSHIAAAVGTPSVVISCGAEVSRWAPGRPALHRVLWAEVPCRPCTHARCPTGHECAMAVGPCDVVDHALSLLRRTETDPARGDTERPARPATADSETPWTLL